MPQNKVYSHALSYLSKLVNPHRKWYFIASFLAVISVGMGLLNVKATQRLVDGAVAGDMTAVWRNAALFIVIIAANYIIARVSGASVARLSAGASRDMKREVAEALVTMG
jgi:ABC-type multidrug transport system fused ATPase/permease subunit